MGLRSAFAPRPDGDTPIGWQVVRNMAITLAVGAVIGALIGFGPVMALASVLAALFGFATAMRFGDNLEADTRAEVQRGHGAGIASGCPSVPTAGETGAEQCVTSSTAPPPRWG